MEALAGHLRSTVSVPSQKAALDDASMPSREELLAMVRTLPDVVFRCEQRADGKVYWTFNEGRLAEEFHLTTAEIKDRPLEELFPPPVVERLKLEFDRAFAGDAREFVNELGGRYFRHYPQPVFGPDGRVTALIGFITEVTGLVKAEQRIQELQETSRNLNDLLTARVLEMAQVNKELETFSYTVSHDLRTPLTVIENYAHVLRSAYRAELSPEVLKSVDGMQRAVRRMSLLVENILRLSRVSRSPMHPIPIDLADVARDVVRELKEREPERAVEVVIPAHVPARGDANILRIALANLLGNAWKFTSKTPSPRIEFGHQTDGRHEAYFVRDNGAGFDPAESSRLFRLFERLHPIGEYEGTGIGLVTVERAVGRHGGRVWAEGQPGRGATFFFTLARANDPIEPHEPTQVIA